MITSVSFAKKSLPPSQIGVFLRDYHGIAQGLHLKFLKNWKPRLISRLWEVAGTRYEDDKLVKQCASSTLLSDGDSATMPLEYWTCRTSGGQAPIAWMNFFKKDINSSCQGQTELTSFICGCGILYRVSFPMFVMCVSICFEPILNAISERQVADIKNCSLEADITNEFTLGVGGEPFSFPRCHNKVVGRVFGLTVKYLSLSNSSGNM
ncbi:hypothetical protein IFM89_007185 [Coptis chinensis]|uniref:Uncharacterized protein n=1 Tax=Coptis chinensis TaxID=261450 RepID=A0A835HD89_9MAGN|nr:hypothetical protein IFM89_007185 [Coptis chinensis]